MRIVAFVGGHGAVADQLGVPGVIEVDEGGCGLQAQAVALAGARIEDEFQDISQWLSVESMRASSAGIASARRRRRSAVR